MSEWIEKVWGQTKEVISTSCYSYHELLVNAGGYCSIHYHKERANKFRIINGKIEIIQFYGPKIERTMLGNDQTYEVPSLVPHMFVVHKSGRMVEEYYPDRCGYVTNDDIIRLVEGGIEDIDKLDRLPLRLLRNLIGV